MHDFQGFKVSQAVYVHKQVKPEIKPPFDGIFTQENLYQKLLESKYM